MPESSTGTILFGGYDHDKYIGDLNTLPIQPSGKTNKVDTMFVEWTSLCIHTPGFDLSITPPNNFSANAVLDSGTTLTGLPTCIFSDVATYFGAANVSNVWIVNCSIAAGQGSVDFGFGDTGQRISVDFSELALPILYPNGSSITNGAEDACLFGFMPIPDGEDILFGDTFLRSAYVVYDLDKQEISMAPTNFKSTTSNITEIVTGGPV